MRPCVRRRRSAPSRSTAYCPAGRKRQRYYSGRIASIERGAIPSASNPGCAPVTTLSDARLCTWSRVSGRGGEPQRRAVQPVEDGPHGPAHREGNVDDQPPAPDHGQHRLHQLSERVHVRPAQLVRAGLGAPRRGERRGLGHVVHVDGLEARRGAHHRQDRARARHAREAVEELVLRPEHDRGGAGWWPAGTPLRDEPLALALGARVVAARLGVGADRADLDERARAGLGGRARDPGRALGLDRAEGVGARLGEDADAVDHRVRPRGHRAHPRPRCGRWRARARPARWSRRRARTAPRWDGGRRDAHAPALPRHPLRDVAPDEARAAEDRHELHHGRRLRSPLQLAEAPRGGKRPSAAPGRRGGAQPWTSPLPPPVRPRPAAGSKGARRPCWPRAAGAPPGCRSRWAGAADGSGSGSLDRRPPSRRGEGRRPSGEPGPPSGARRPKPPWGSADRPPPRPARAESGILAPGTRAAAAPRMAPDRARSPPDLGRSGDE